MKAPIPTLVRIVDERLAKSVTADLFTLGLLLALVYVGIALSSVVLQIIGAMAWIIFLAGRARGNTGRIKTLTISQARLYLDTLEAEGRDDA